MICLPLIVNLPLASVSSTMLLWTDNHVLRDVHLLLNFRSLSYTTLTHCLFHSKFQ